MRRFPLILGTIVAAAHPGAAPIRADAPASQPATQPAAPRREPPPSLLNFEDLRFELGFDGEYQRRQVDSNARGLYRTRHRQTNEDWRLEETLGMRTRGALIHERALRFDVAARWGLSQESYFERRPGPDLRERPHGDVLEYDLRLDVLPAGKISGTLFGSQLDDRIPRPFQPSLDRRRERYGAELLFNDPVWPMRLTWEHVFDELTSRTRELLDDEQRGQDTLRYELTWQPSEYHSLRLEYEYDDRRERFSGTDTRFDTTRNYLILDHVLRFGRDHQSRLETLARFQDETGDLARDTYEISPQLRLQHSDALATTYRAQYLKESFQQLDLKQWRGDVGLIHQLGTSLTSTLNMHALRQNTDEQGGGRGGGADATEWGGTANFAFTRDNRFGRLSANLGYSHIRTRTTHGRRGGIVLAETVTFRDPQPVYLVKTEIEAFTILVTDAGRTRTYLPGRDYVVTQIGRYTALHRLRNGQIADRQTVQVSYTYRTNDNYEQTRDRIDFRVQQNFKFGLTPYYAGSLQEEDVGGGRFSAFRERNVNRHRVGATYRRPRWSVGLEYEYNDDSIDPYEALHANGDVVLLESAWQQLNGRGTLSRFLFDGSRDLRSHDTTLLDLGLSYRRVFGRNLEGDAAAAYRFEDDSLFGRTHGVDLTGALAYRIGLFSLRLEAEYDLLDLPGSDDNTLAVWLKLRREIPLLTRSVR